MVSDAGEVPVIWSSPPASSQHDLSLEQPASASSALKTELTFCG